MAGIKVSYHVVREKSGRLESQILNILDGNILTGYRKIEEAVSRSCGTAAEALMENIGQEREAVLELRAVMMKMLELLKDSTDTFEEVERSYCALLEEKGD